MLIRRATVLQNAPNIVKIIIKKAEGNTMDIKYKLAEAMKSCMKTSSVESITVKQIVETCGVSRQSFYRNFIDKYDLINWYFD